MNCDQQHEHCQLQCAECKSYECQDQGYHRELPWLHRRDWMAIARGLPQAICDDDMPVDRELYFNDRAEKLP